MSAYVESDKLESCVECGTVCNADPYLLIMAHDIALLLCLHKVSIQHDTVSWLFWALSIQQTARLDDFLWMWMKSYFTLASRSTDWSWNTKLIARQDSVSRKMPALPKQTPLHQKVRLYHIFCITWICAQLTGLMSMHSWIDRFG